MKAMENDWYKKIWTLDIQNQSWVEDTHTMRDTLDTVDPDQAEPAAEPIHQSVLLFKSQEPQ